MKSINHVAIIMDGNGRWAKDRGRPRIWGHVRGANRVSGIVSAASELGLSSLTLYTFSTENWSRPKEEINSLFKLLRKFLAKEKKNLEKNNIKFDVIGNYAVLENGVVDIIDEIKESTKNNTGLNLSLAINYGGRTEIVDAVNDFLQESQINEITEEDISKHMYNRNLSEVDLIIRTAGERRVSNFLLWQLSYAEFYFSDIKWPDFQQDDFVDIIYEVDQRERRFGGINSTNNIIRFNRTSLGHEKLGH